METPTPLPCTLPGTIVPWNNAPALYSGMARRGARPESPVDSSPINQHLPVRPKPGKPRGSIVTTHMKGLGPRSRYPGQDTGP